MIAMQYEYISMYINVCTCVFYSLKALKLCSIVILITGLLSVLLISLHFSESKSYLPEYDGRSEYWTL